MADRDDYILFSGGAPGAEMAFGEYAERLGIEEVNFAFEGHVHQRTRGLRILNHEELRAGEVMTFVPDRPNPDRRYAGDCRKVRKLLGPRWRPTPFEEIIDLMRADFIARRPPPLD